MKPLEILGKTTTPDGKELVLYGRDDRFQIRIDGLELMTNGAFGSEEALATEVCAELQTESPRILIGGLGMGYTLRAALDALPEDARVDVVEVFESVVSWNRGPLAHISRQALDDPRVTVVIRDVADVIRETSGLYDALLLDVDNGPEGLVMDRNDRIYSDQGVERCREALRPGGILAVWSSSPARHFEERLRDRGFRAEHRPIRAKGSSGPHHSLYLGYRDSVDGSSSVTPAASRTSS